MKICPTIKKFQNIMNMIASQYKKLIQFYFLKLSEVTEESVLTQVQQNLASEN